MQDGFRNLSEDCSHWFLTHFHTEHYQGLTRGFRFGTIYCSAITAKLVHLKIGVPPERVRVLPLNRRVEVEGVGVTFLDADHCVGAVMILFEPPSGEPVLHTGDFRWGPLVERQLSPLLAATPIHTLILDTTYCHPQYKFPDQSTVVERVIEAVAAEAFNPRTLCLLGVDTIGKERLFLDLARALQRKLYVGSAKLRMLECMDLPPGDLQWLTASKAESDIHAVPMWSIATFKRMAQCERSNKGRYDTIVAFFASGTTSGRGKRGGLGRKMRKGTLVRYEIPYSEHCSFSELREFVQFADPVSIIPSVNNDSPEAAEAMIGLLYEEEEVIQTARERYEGAQEGEGNSEEEEEGEEEEGEEGGSGGGRGGEEDGQQGRGEGRKGSEVDGERGARDIGSLGEKGKRLKRDRVQLSQ